MTATLILLRALMAACGLALFGLTIAGLAPPGWRGAEDPARAFAVRAADSTISPWRAWREIDRARRQYRNSGDAAAFAEAVTMIVNRRMTNVLQHDVDERAAMAPALTESWILWALNQSDGRFNTYEYHDPARALRRGLGQCGAQSIALARILAQEGLLVSLWGSPVHVTVLAETPDGTRLALDPDYGATMREPFAAEAVAAAYAEMAQLDQESAIPTIARHYAERTQLDDVDALAGIRYSRETFYGLQPQRFEALVRWAEWGAPLLLIGLALAPGLFARARSGAKTLGKVVVAA